MRYTVKVENVAFSKHNPCYILKICVIDINGIKENYIVPVDSKADVERLIKAVNNVKEEVKNESND